MPRAMSRFLHCIGGGVAVLGVVFVVLRLKDYGSDIDLSAMGRLQWIALAGLSLVYGSANILLALAWLWLLRQSGVAVRVTWALRAYGISQLAKYVPGNIFHLAGRQAVGMAAGLPAGALARSMLWEMLLIIAAGGLFGALVLPAVWPGCPVAFGVLFWLLSIFIAFRLVARFLGPLAAQALLLQIIFLTISASVFVALLALLNTSSAADRAAIPPLLGAYVIAWLAGLVTPGAPAGVGIRELVLLLILKGSVVETDLLLATLLGRVITVSGDLLYFAAATLLPNRFAYRDS